MTPASPARLAFACAAEPTPAWVRRVELLAFSLRTLGGASAGAPLHACFVGKVDDEAVAPLRALDVVVHEVPRFDERLAYANKLRLLELGDRLEPEVEALAMIDCDIVFAGDPARVMPVDRVAAKPADRNPLDADGWRRLGAALGLEIPRDDVVASATGRRMPRFFNSGVVVVPRAQLASLAEAWARWTYRVVDVLEADALVVPRARRFFADQYALMAAMAEHDGVALPVAANCPTHVRLHPGVLEGHAPAVLHYHARMWPDGLLQRPVAPEVAGAAARYNAARARADGLAEPALRPPPLRTRAARVRAQATDAVLASWTFTRVQAAMGGPRSERVA